MSAMGNMHLLELAVSDLDIQTERRSPMDIVSMVREEMGREYQPTRRQVFVRVDPMVSVTPGGLVLTGQESSFYRGPGHAKILKSTVIARGPLSSVEVGDRVCFQRLYFARLSELSDGTFVGAVDENELVGYIVEE